MKPVVELSPSQIAGVRFVLMDIDDTLTLRGKLPVSSFNALWKLKEKGFKVIPITGRPAGWCDCIVRQWPVDGIVGENGAFAFWEDPQDGKLPQLKSMFHPNSVRNDHHTLGRVRERALAEVPGLRDAKDQFSRLFDIALDFAEEEPVLPYSAAEKARDIALSEGAKAKISSIHVNIWMGNYDKLSMTEKFLREHFGWQGDVTQVLFTGDSPNDEPMFARFPLACAVANICHCRHLMHILPAYVTAREGGDGFAEIVEILISP